MIESGARMTCQARAIYALVIAIVASASLMLAGSILSADGIDLLPDSVADRLASPLAFLALYAVAWPLVPRIAQRLPITRFRRK